MGYTPVALKEKILEMYPELRMPGMSVGLSWDEDKKAFVVSMKKDGKSLTTHIEKKDADACIDGIMCPYLGVQVKQFLDNFKTRV